MTEDTPAIDRQAPNAEEARDGGAGRYAALLKRSQVALRDGTAINPLEVKVSSESQGGFESKIQIRDFTLTIDQPKGFEGGNKGPKPSEVLLAALASCQEITWRLYADALGIELRGIKVELTGTQDLRGFLDLSEEVPAGFQGIRGKVTIDSPASETEIQKLRQVVDSHCPVLDDLRRPVPVALELERD
ncbi:MAG: OsmC family protein [Rhodovibrionaceae bacterium]